jgi:hypothetical protein
MAKNVTKKTATQKMDRAVRGTTPDSADRAAILASVKHKVELWEKQDAGDTQAIVELSVLAGLMSAEDARAFDN